MRRVIRIITLLLTMLVVAFLMSCTQTETSEVASSAEPQNLQGELTILVQEIGGRPFPGDFAIYARMFNQLHPDVTFVFEGYQGATDNAQQIALTTRLLAEPPDIFWFQPSFIAFEKVIPDSLFVNLNTFFDGPRGINRENYFNNIFEGAESGGGLFHLPFWIIPEFVFLNRELFDAIEVDISTISSINVDDEIDFFNRVAHALPHRIIQPNYRFSPMQVLMREKMYDLQTDEVFIDTPEVLRRMELAVEIGLPSSGPRAMGVRPMIEFLPGEFIETDWGGSTTWAATTLYLQPSDSLFFSSRDGSNFNAGLMFLQDHPDVTFSNPIPYLTTGGDVLYRSAAIAIMQNSSNHNLAWEFLRFIMEFEESLFTGPLSEYIGVAHHSINRRRFEAQVTDFLTAAFDDVLAATNLALHLGLEEIEDPQYRMERQIEIRDTMVSDALDFNRNMMELLSLEVQHSQAALNSLIYPDIWLLHTGRQNVPTTLRNIQNRLELYVAE